MKRFGPFLVGVLELVALVVVAGWIGLGWALLLLLSTSVLGLALLRIAGFRAWAALRSAAADGVIDGGDAEGGAASSNRMADTGVRILSGVLLILPGFVTDLVGLILLIPPIRHSVGRRLSAAAFRTFPGRRPGGGMPGTGQQPGGVQHGVVIEGEVIGEDRRENP